MPGFTSNSTGLAVYKIENPEKVTFDKLKKYAFLPIDGLAGETRGLGWTSIEDMADTTWADSIPEKGNFMTFALRVDTRKVPGPVLKKHLQEAIRKEEEKNKAEGRAFISRARKKELKEMHTAKLLAKAEPVPATVDIAVDISNGLVYVAGTSKSMLGAFQEHMNLSFGEMPVPLQSVLAGAHSKEGEEQTLAGRLLHDIHEEAQPVDFDGHNYTASFAGQISLAGISDGEAVEVTSKNEDESVKAGLEAGLNVSKLKIQLERADMAASWIFTLNTDFAFSGLKTPHVDTSDDDDPDAGLLEKLYLISQAVGAMAELLRAKLQ